MKKTNILFLCCLFASQVLFSQRNAEFVSPDRLFFEAKNMYNDKNYAGCIDKLTQYKLLSVSKGEKQEADFLLLASAYKQGNQEVIADLKDFLDQYPEDRHANEIAFMIGSLHFAEHEYKLAEFWFKRCELDLLSIEDQEDYAFRMAYSNLQLKKNDEARRLFGLLRDNSEKYHVPATYYYACMLYQNGEYDSALQLFSNMKNTSEFHPGILYYITQIHFIQKRYTQTIHDGTELLNKYPHEENNAEMNRLIGVSYFQEGDYNNAAKYLSTYAKMAGTGSRNDMYMLGMAYFKLKDYRSAITYLGHGISLEDAMGQNANLHLGQAYLKTGDSKNALMAFEAASRANFDPQIKEFAMYNYALLLYQTSSSGFGESVTVLENFVNTYPNSRYADKINDCLVEVYLTTKNYDTALRSIEKIKNPGTKILEAKQKIYYHLGTVYFTNAEYLAALSYFTKAITAGNYAPLEKSQAIFWRAEAYYRKEDYSSAATDYRSFLSASNRDPQLLPNAYYGLGYCYFQQHQYDPAQSTLQNYVNTEKDTSKPELADAYARIGDCYFYKRSFAAAENAYSQAVKLQPSMAAYSLYQKGFVLGLQKDYKGKINQLDLLVQNYPDSRYVPDALYEKGRAYVMMENPNPAIQTFENLMNKYPQSAYARKAGVQIGLLYFNQNDLKKSVTAYKKVIEKYPGSEEARVAMQDLKSVYVEMNDVSGYAQYANKQGGEAKFGASEQDSLTYLAAERFFMRGDEQQAKTAMQNYLNQFAEGSFSANANYYLGQIEYNQKAYEPAKNYFQKVVAAGNTAFLEKALAGAMRSAVRLKDNATIIQMADILLKESKLDPELYNESLYNRSKAYVETKQTDKAAADWKILSKDTRTAYGAEAKYLLAQYYFDNHSAAQAEAEVQEYIKQGTPHAYWLARSYILLSDIYKSRNDLVLARQYLESLQHNYKNTGDDIPTMIQQRLAGLSQ